MSSKRYFQGNLAQLTSLRFFAALLVLFSHLSILERAPGFSGSILSSIFHEGYSGVSFFFILSGFILEHSYHNRILSGTTTKREYILTRLARVYPLHLIVALPFIIISATSADGTAIPQAALNIFLLQSWIPRADYYFSLNMVSWTLSNEIFFYCMFLALTKMRSRSLQIGFLVFFLLILFALLASIASGLSSWKDNIFGRTTHWIFYINPVFRLLEFVCGILIYRFASQLTRLSGSAHEITSISAALAIMCLAAQYSLPETLRSQLLYFPIFAYVLASFAEGKGILSKIISHRIFVFLGEASFCLYISHQPIIKICANYLVFPGLDDSPLAIALIMILTCLTASVLLHKFVEKPIYTRLKAAIRPLS
jgi:peptidoglycan/LPS O-acetylase OafA/YrhL